MDLAVKLDAGNNTRRLDCGKALETLAPLESRLNKRSLTLQRCHSRRDKCASATPHSPTMPNKESILIRLPLELLHLWVFELGVLSPLDVLRLALTSSVLHSALLSTEFDRDQHRALAGALFCVNREWDLAARLALIRKIDSSETIGEDLIIGASAKGCSQTMRVLLADPRIDPSADANCAIRFAVENGRTETLKLLLADPRVDPSDKNNAAIRFASAFGHTETVKLLLSDPRVDPTDTNNAAIRFASHNGRTETVALLLADPRVDPAANFNQAIRMAAFNGHTEAAALLLADPRVDPSDGNDKAIQMAATGGHAKIVALLLADDRVDPSVENNYAIRIASGHGYREIVALLLTDSRVKARIQK